MSDADRPGSRFKAARPGCVRRPWRYYRFGETAEVAVRSRGLPDSMTTILEPNRIDNPLNPSMGLVIGRFSPESTGAGVTSSRFPKASSDDVDDSTAVAGMSSRRHHGYYKGIPWEIAIVTCPGTNQVQCYFHSRPLFTFLAWKMVLAPYLNRLFARQGCLPLCGSSFRQDDVQYVLTGFAGSGKTRRMLEAVSRGATFCGDEEMYLSNTGEVKRFFHFLSLKLGAVHHTEYWSRLDSRTRMKLRINHIISRLILRKISFTAMMDFKKIFFGRRTAPNTSPPGRLVFIHLDGDSGVRKSTGEDFLDIVARRDAKHRTWFGSLFYSEEDFTAISESIAPSLSRHSFWRVPATCSLEDILKLE